eukprot:gnl/Spiro4/7994_TR4202_c0_g1_i2.p1 gnl/Spiro4/7994_TR4202_c0_g1~~gnl/Spiro4/7994_TR4202_c0_g1_i2.p1  ORF type:complete len:367 (-),score=47.68 gnl/Spiro4/7994_TR4202_c0_g1_i2:32-1132(-)
MASLLSQGLLYFCGPFFCFPWKPLVNRISGVDYSTAYSKHFRRDHSDPVNLALHAVCLVLQLWSNFALLAHIDALLIPHLHEFIRSNPPHHHGSNNNSLLNMISSVLSVFFTPQSSSSASSVPGSLVQAISSCVASRPVSLCTLLLWAGHLVMNCTGVAPRACIIAAVSSLVGAFIVAPWIDGVLLEACCVYAFAIVLVIGLPFIPQRAAKTMVVAVLWCLWPGAWHLAGTALRASFSPSPVTVIGVVVFLVLAVSLSPRVPEAPAFVGSLACRLGGILASQPALQLWSCAFTAPLLQGTSHSMTGEMATLINHNRRSTSKTGATLENPEHPHSLKVALEWAHTTFFPTLAFHSMHQSVFGTKAAD